MSSPTVLSAAAAAAAPALPLLESLDVLLADESCSINNYDYLDWLEYVQEMHCGFNLSHLDASVFHPFVYSPTNYEETPQHVAFLTRLQPAHCHLPLVSHLLYVARQVAKKCKLNPSRDILSERSQAWLSALHEYLQHLPANLPLNHSAAKALPSLLVLFEAFCLTPLAQSAFIGPANVTFLDDHFRSSFLQQLVKPRLTTLRLLFQDKFALCPLWRSYAQVLAPWLQRAQQPLPLHQVALNYKASPPPLTAAAFSLVCSLPSGLLTSTLCDYLVSLVTNESLLFVRLVQNGLMPVMLPLVEPHPDTKCQLYLPRLATQLAQNRYEFAEALANEAVIVSLLCLFHPFSLFSEEFTSPHIWPIIKDELKRLELASLNVFPHAIEPDQHPIALQAAFFF
jgi:hypothetical protein